MFSYMMSKYKNESGKFSWSVPTLRLSGIRHYQHYPRIVSIAPLFSLLFSIYFYSSYTKFVQMPVSALSCHFTV